MKIHIKNINVPKEQLEHFLYNTLNLQDNCTKIKDTYVIKNVELCVYNKLTEYAKELKELELLLIISIL